MPAIGCGVAFLYVVGSGDCSVITKTALKFKVPDKQFMSRLVSGLAILKNIQPEHLRLVRRGAVLAGALGGGSYYGNEQYKRRRRRTYGVGGV